MSRFFGFITRTYRTKTFQLCVAGLGGIAQQYYNGAMDGKTALIGVFVCLYGIFNRDAVIKSGPNGGV